MHSTTILEVLIGLAVQIAVEDWGLEGARAILSDTMTARLSDKEGFDEPRH
jgi:hypothetical protein